MARIGRRKCWCTVVVALLIAVSSAEAAESLNRRDVDSIRNKFEQSRNVTVDAHLQVVPTAPPRPTRFDPLPVITTGSGNALPPHSLTQASSKSARRDYYVEGQCAHPTSYGQCMGFMTCCLMHRIPLPCHVMQPCGMLVNSMPCIDMPPMRHLFPTPGHVVFPEDNKLEVPNHYKNQGSPPTYNGVYPPRPMQHPHPEPLPRVSPDPEPHPRPGSEPYPRPGPEPYPRPVPEPYPQPAPEPYPRLAPEPYPRPAPEPYPRPAPEPYPRPAPEPYPRPAPEPYPHPAPEPYPHPAPEPYPRPAPEPYPRPAPEPYPRPAPEPFPEPHPQPAPEPFPEPLPQPQPGPYPDPRPRPYPRPHPRPYPEPMPGPFPEPEPQPEPEPEPRPIPIPDPKAHQSNFQCPAQYGEFADSRDCRRFWQCVGYQARMRYCGEGELFDRNHLCCLPAHMVTRC